MEFKDKFSGIFQLFYIAFKQDCLSCLGCHYWQIKSVIVEIKAIHWSLNHKNYCNLSIYCSGCCINICNLFKLIVILLWSTKGIILLKKPCFVGYEWNIEWTCLLQCSWVCNPSNIWAGSRFLKHLSVSLTQFGLVVWNAVACLPTEMTLLLIIMPSAA